MIGRATAVAAAMLVAAGTSRADVLFSEDFADGLSDWTASKAMKGDDKYDGQWNVVTEDVDPTAAAAAAAKDGKPAAEPNKVLVIGEAAKHYCLSRAVAQPVTLGEGDVVMQYTVQFKETMGCGGSYLKLLSAADDLDLAAVADKTPYTILFGPDKCGGEQNLRFIFRFKSPVTGEYSEVHARRIQEPHKIFRDRKTHLLTLVLHGGNESFSMSVDGEMVLAGGLGAADRFSPALIPSEKIDDPEDSKPDDWVDAEFMDDPEDIKPEEWVDAATIPDPDATMPDDWDAEMDGEWEAPDIKNPEFKGVWKAERIKNPAYTGQWSPRKIDNPEFFNETKPMGKLDPIGAVAFELWTTTKGITFDDIVITTDVGEAAAAAEHWRVRRAAEDANDYHGPFAIFTKVAKTLWGFVRSAVSQVMNPDVFDREVQPWVDAGIENPLLGGGIVLLLFSPLYLLVSVVCCRSRRRDEDEGYDDGDGENDVDGESDGDRAEDDKADDDSQESEGGAAEAEATGPEADS